MIKPHTVELDIGYLDAKKIRHTRVTFGQRINGKRLFEIDQDPLGKNNTQYTSLILRAQITEFGTLKMPVPLNVLLSLDSIDRDDLVAASDEFNSGGLTDDGERALRPELASETVVKLAVGYEAHGIRYDVVEFGRRLTGMDEVEADSLGLKDVRRRCFLAGKQVQKLSQRDGASTLDGPIGFDIFESLDLVDIYALLAAAEVWRQSFRRAGARVQPERNGAQCPAADDADTSDRSGDPKLASRTLQ